MKLSISTAFSLVLRFLVLVSSSICLLLLLFTSTTTTMINAQISQVRSILSSREQVLDRLVKQAESFEATRCSRLSSFSVSTNCQTAGCGSTFSTDDGFKCEKSYGKDPNTCSGCDGLIRSVNKSTVLFAPRSDFASVDIQAFLSYGKSFDAIAQAESNNFKGWVGMAATTGASRWFPGSPRQRSSSSCSAYDPRLRNWYLVSAKGPTDVVIVIDSSGSMLNRDCTTCHTRMEMVKDAVSSLLQGFTILDYFAVVNFESVGNIVTSGGATLHQGTKVNIEAAQKAMEEVYASGGTSYTSGFQKAFEIFRSSTERTSGCQRIILFLTDGYAQDSDSIKKYISDQQATLGSSRQAAIMTFSMSSGASTGLPQDIACANNGIWSGIRDGVNPLDAMSSYYKFLAFGMDSSTPRWSEIYNDIFTNEKVTTVSRSVYDRTNAAGAHSHGIFVGVVEIDVPLGELLKLASEADITVEITSRSQVCPDTNITVCDMQLLRNAAGKECPSEMSLATCRSSNSVDEIVSCSSGISGGVNSMFCGSESLNSVSMLSATNPKSYQAVVCCPGCSDSSSSAGLIVGIVLASIAGVILLFFIILYMIKAQDNRRQADNDANDKVRPMLAVPQMSKVSVQHNSGNVLRPSMNVAANASPYSGSGVSPYGDAAGTNATNPYGVNANPLI